MLNSRAKHCSRIYETIHWDPGIILFMLAANEIRGYNATSSLIGGPHIQNDPWMFWHHVSFDIEIDFVHFTEFTEVSTIAKWKHSESKFKLFAYHKCSLWYEVNVTTCDSCDDHIHTLYLFQLTASDITNSLLVAGGILEFFVAIVSSAWCCQALKGTENAKQVSCGVISVWLNKPVIAMYPLRPGHTARYGLIATKTRQKVVSREADGVVRVDVEFKTNYSRFIDVTGRGGKSERRRTRQKVLNYSKF